MNTVIIQYVDSDISGSTLYSLKGGETCFERLSGSSSSSFHAGEFIFSEHQGQAPQPRAAVSDAINQALELVAKDDNEQVFRLEDDDDNDDSSSEDRKQKRAFRKELLKDDMGLFYKELARLRLERSSTDGESSFSSHTEDDSESEGDGEDSISLWDFEVSASDLFRSMDNRIKPVE